MRFTKMEGCGNDYIYINGFEEEVKYPDMLAVAMSERHFGVGADGLVLILPSEVAELIFANPKMSYSAVGNLKGVDFANTVEKLFS